MLSLSYVVLHPCGLTGSMIIVSEIGQFKLRDSHEYLSQLEEGNCNQESTFIHIPVHHLSSIQYVVRVRGNHLFAKRMSN
jgi:hypothetical protein